MAGKTKGIKLSMKGKKGSKSSAKKLLKKTQKSKLTNASIDDLAPAPPPSPISEPVKSSDSASVTDTTEDMNNSEPIPGFIFLCNRKTKARCFQYQVFGLPLFQKKSVEKIKPGTKLFLFDYGMRLLHGIYEATSEGKDNVDPDAFEGKFLAQVKFRIVKECLPVPEMFFRNCVLENYHAGRLILELSEQQVNRLVPLFSPLESSLSSSEPVDMVLPNAAASQPLLPTRVEDQYHRNLNRRQSMQTVNSQPIQSVYQQPAAVAVANQVHPSSQQRRAPNPVNSYNADSQGLYSSTRGNSYNAHSQGLYSSTRDNPYNTHSQGLHSSTRGNPYNTHSQGLYSSTRGNPYNTHSQGLYSSTRGYTVVMQEPYARYITEPEWLLQNHTMGLGNDYHSWALMREPLYSGHCPHQHNSFSTMQPHAPVYGIPEVPYLAYASSGRPQANYAVPYVSTAMPAYVAASAWPDEHYAMAAAAYDASSMMFPYATASGWHEPNHPMPAASYVTMPRGGTASGIPVPNVPMSSHFTYLGPNRFFN